MNATTGTLTGSLHAELLLSEGIPYSPFSAEKILSVDMNSPASSSVSPVYLFTRVGLHVACKTARRCAGSYDSRIALAA